MANLKGKKSKIKPERPGGFLDYLPADFLARQKMIDTIARVYRSFGYNPIETPRIEFLKTLEGEESDTGKNIFHIKNSEDSEALAMPFDHTVPLARLLAANPYNPKDRSGIRLPWRRMVVGPVFRGESPQSGRYRQFYQFDADIAGSDSMLAEAEIITMIYRTLRELGVQKFLIKINNRKILDGLAELAGIKSRGAVSRDEIVQAMMRILDKLDKIGLQGVMEELQKAPENEADPAPNLSEEAAQKFSHFLEITGDNAERIKQAKEIFKGIKIAEEGIAELEDILAFCESLEVLDDFINIDFSIARGLDYYSGPVMETVLIGAEEYGSVFSGGRYDGLVKRFTGETLPAVGASVGVDRLFAALNHLGLIDRKKSSVADVIVLRLAPGKDEEYLKMANTIRKAGMNTELCLLSDLTFGSQFNFALGSGARYAIICGEDEFKQNKIAIKDMQKREQVLIEQGELGEYFEKIK